MYYFLRKKRPVPGVAGNTIRQRLLSGFQPDADGHYFGLREKIYLSLTNEPESCVVTYRRRTGCCIGISDEMDRVIQDIANYTGRRGVKINPQVI